MLKQIKSMYETKYPQPPPPHYTFSIDTETRSSVE